MHQLGTPLTQADPMAFAASGDLPVHGGHLEQLARVPTPSEPLQPASMSYTRIGQLAFPPGNPDQPLQSANLAPSVQPQAANRPSATSAPTPGSFVFGDFGGPDNLGLAYMADLDDTGALDDLAAVLDDDLQPGMWPD